MRETIVTTLQPVWVDLLPKPIDEERVLLHTIVNGTLVPGATMLVDGNPAEYLGLFSEPVFLHLCAREHEDGSVGATLVVQVGNTEQGPWLPGPLFTHPEVSKDAPPVTPIAEFLLDPETRIAPDDFIAEAKQILSFVVHEDVQVSDVHERAIDDVLTYLSSV